MKDKPVVALDMDEVLFNFADSYQQWRAHRGLAPVDLGQMTGYQFFTGLGMSATEANEHEIDFLSEFDLRAQPMEGAIAGVAELGRSAELIVLTARVESLHGELTQRWLGHYFPGAFTDIVLTHKTPERSLGSKGEFATRLGVSALVDDYVGHLESIKEPTKGVLFGRRPNTIKSKLPSNCIRVESWSELPEQIAKLIR